MLVAIGLVVGVWGYAQTSESALADYVRIYQKYLHREPGTGTCAMFPSCSRYGLMVFDDCYFHKAMVYMADRMIRCGHDFDAYDLTLQNGQLLLLDLPPYRTVSRDYVYAPKLSFAYTDWKEEQDSSLLYVNYLINRQMYREALFAIEEIQFKHRLLSEQLFVNKLNCYNSLNLVEDAIYDYEIRFPGVIKKSSKVKFEMLNILIPIGNYDMAECLLREISDDTTSLIVAQKYAWQGILCSQREDWKEADVFFKRLSKCSPDMNRDECNKSLVQKAMNFRKKKAGLAASLSVIPGLGYIYTGRPKSALTAFVMNSLLGYAVFSSIKKENYGVAALLGVFNLSFYIGNITGAKRSASQYNQRALGKIQSTLYQNNRQINKN